MTETLNQESSNVALVRRLYESGMAPEVVAEVMAEDLVFDITPGFPFGGVYNGWPDVAENFFGRIMPELASYGPVTHAFHGSEDHVFVSGHYHAVSHAGQTADIRFTHDWTIKDGKLAQLIQSADSHVLQQLIA
ncbi:nuclear transport factor 2 family protein [Kocuria sp.]|uniref:nuclear transport factor 2 family protein n=1 Tax=Kocuria sp. TaxID=1871328 RepID=UPI0026E04041|nr:nuclear transport factor 2 family protein [Kocuria sp.]MDO5617302.1 nuclear transport factor 2 family protein [Kocuria sp.]